eukprot:CAMPEP_0185167182 /NCGR_PEP_ID=MMETSP1139-20130426/13827_1 /TAXON_ID=298111 /ORGANISM="Pavlova sp., Strain CCMP459" /LENGTH=132 /DNA_ID=CAMNT_0027732653 /DNA_START=141 /DNA_END=539 /DNA_ORIENTATION=-
MSSAVRQCGYVHAKVVPRACALRNTPGRRRQAASWLCGPQRNVLQISESTAAPGHTSHIVRQRSSPGPPDFGPQCSRATKQYNPVHEARGTAQPSRLHTMEHRTMVGMYKQSAARKPGAGCAESHRMTSFGV